MRIRLYSRADVADIATIHAWCNKTDAIARYFYLDIEKYPTSYRRGNWRFIRSTTLEPGSKTIVVETEPEDYPLSERHKAPEIVGYAKYSRHGESKLAKEWQQTNTEWWAKLERALIGLEDRYYSLVPRAQPSWNKARSTELRPIMAIPFDEEIFAEALELDLCYVRPDWQRRGIGKRLINWGFEQGQREKIPVLVKSSPVGAAAYRSCGFKEIAEYSFAEFFDILVYGGETCKGWVWEPTLDEDDPVEGKWYERSLEKAERIRTENAVEIE